MNDFRNMKAWKKAAITIAVLFLLGYIFCLPRQLFYVDYSTVVSDRNGELLGARIAGDGQWRFPERETVPENLKVGLVEFEDRHFYRHWGVNPLAIGRAIKQNAKEEKVVSGGSTLTMQVIRLSRNKPRTVGEKIIEIILATRLEFRYSKDEILALYASHAPFGGNVVGLDAASWRFFGHSADNLSWAEAATLAVLPNAPAMIHLSKSRRALMNKRNRLLSRLHEKGLLDKTTYDLALSEELPQEPLPLPQIAPHLVSHLHATDRGQDYISTIDKGIQTRVEGIIEQWNDEFSQSNIRNMAAMVIDVRTNEVVAYCGNVRFHETGSGNQVDIIRSPRSTGSILKPFLFYAMLEEGEILPHTLQTDIPININGFTPQNFNLQYEGAVPASEVIARSLNIPCVLMLRQYSVPKFHSFLQQIGLTTLTRPASHYGLSLILGGAEATLWDVTSAYSDMARSLEGLGRTPVKLLLNGYKEISNQKSLFRAGSVWQVFDAIKEVNRPEEIDWRGVPSMQRIAWKTGTSYGFRDGWAVGVTPRYAIGVWVGNASGEGKAGLVGARTAGPVLFDLFNALPSSPWFRLPHDELIEVEVCRHSGYLKSRFCEETDILLITPSGLRTGACPYHHRVTLSSDGKRRVYEDCIDDDVVMHRNWFVLPPTQEWYYKQHHPEYRMLPPLEPGCGEDRLSPMQFIYPQANIQVHLPKQLDGSPGVMTFELAHSNQQTTVYWHLDEEYLTSTEDYHKVSLTPLPGNHSMTVVDGEGNTCSVQFSVAK